MHWVAHGFGRVFREELQDGHRSALLQLIGDCDGSNEIESRF